MNTKKIFVGGVCVAMFLLIIGCIGLWGFEKYMDSASLLHQLDLKVNTPNTNIPTSVLTPSEVTKQIAELRATLDKTQHFVTRSTDARGRRMLDAQDVGYLAASSAATELPKDWNAGPFGHNTSTQIETSDYRLQIPFNEAWGNAAYTVSPYERNQQEQILFGPITYMEMTGAYRYGGFEAEPRRPLSEAMSDPSYQSESCGGPSEAPKMIQVGTHQLVRSEKEYCEGVTILYILPGKRFNYTFILKNWVDEELLKWTIEHFEEK